MKLINKYQNAGKVIIKDPYANQKAGAIASNKREANIAKAYFNEAPTIPNLIKGAWHWLNSQPAFLGQNEHPEIQSGVIYGPSFKAQSAAEALQYVKALKAAKAARSSSQTNQIMFDAVKDIQRARNFNAALKSMKK